MDDADLYVVSGTDLRPLVDRVLARAAGAVADEASLLAAAEREPGTADGAFFGASWVMQQVAPSVWGEQGSRAELLLFAALAVLDERDVTPWQGCREHIVAALRHLGAIGEQEAARRLRDRVENAAHEEPNPLVDELRARSLGYNPGRLAAHDQEMAKAARRDLRAAEELMRRA